MKPNFLIIMAAATMILAGCSNDENGAIDNGPVELRLTSGVEVQQTRAAFAPTQSTVIKENEIVSVWVDDATSSTALHKANQLTADGKNGFTGDDMFFPQTGYNVNIYAIHGKFTNAFSKGANFPKGGAEYSVEANQSEGGIAYTNSDLLYAYESNVTRNGNPTTQELTFYHMLSKLELAIKIDKGAPELATSSAVTLGSVTLNGKFTPSTTATMSEQTERKNMLTEADTPSTNDMTLGQQTCTDFTTNVFYNEAILVPQDMKDKVLTFKLKDGGTLTYTIPAFSGKSDAVFESGKKYRYHITLNLTGLTVTSKITDWDAVGEAVSGNAEM